MEVVVKMHKQDTSRTIGVQMRADTFEEERFCSFLHHTFQNGGAVIVACGDEAVTWEFKGKSECES